MWVAWDAPVPRLNPAAVSLGERLKACEEASRWAERLFAEGGERYASGRSRRASIIGLGTTCVDLKRPRFDAVSF